MNVFKPAITLFVITMLVNSSGAMAGWVYPVDPPIGPTLTQVVTLHNPTLTQIQDAIAPHTRINVIGTVSVGNGQRLAIDVDDVRLNFAQASKIWWSGGDTWGGFLDISGSRVLVQKLKMEIVANSPGRCRGVMLYTPASDVKLINCEFSNIADGFIADGEFERIALINTKFLNCSDWISPSMDGGCGLFFEDDDWNPDHLLISNVEITLSSNAAQHGMRLSQVENVLIEDTEIGANWKRSFWAYGVENLAIQHTVFNVGSVLFNTKPTEWFTSRPVRNVRMSDCTINHSSILRPLGIYCGHGTVNFRMKDVDIYSSTSSLWLNISNSSADDTHAVCWFDGSVTFNGNQMWGVQGGSILEWTPQQQETLDIGPMDDPRY